jgi:hypothetical protein
VQRERKFHCPACHRITADPSVELCEYDAEELLNMNRVLALMVRKYPSLAKSRRSVVLLRFWGKHVEKDPEHFRLAKKLAAEWRGEYPDEKLPALSVEEYDKLF